MYESVSKSDFMVSEPFISSTNRNRGSRLSYLHNPGKTPFRYMTIGTVVEEAAKKFNQTTAIVSAYDNKRITYQEIFERCDQLAAGFRSLNLKKGDRVGLWGPNTIEWVIVFYAAARAGLITVAINPNYQSKELKYSLNKCGVKVLICPDKYKNISFYNILRDIIPEIETCRTKRLCSDSIPTLKVIITISKTVLRGTYNYYEVLNIANDNDIEKIKQQQYQILPEDIGNIQFSSGTTGQPKAACLNHFQIVNNSYQIGKRFELHDQIFCVQVPLFHVFGIVGCLVSSFQFGATLVFPRPMYNSLANLKVLEQERCTRICGTPTMFIDLISNQSKEKRQIYLTQALVGGSPSSPVLLKNLKEILNIKTVKCIYGATEVTACVFHSLEDEKEGITVGCIGENIEAKVVDANENIVPFGTAGELCIRGYVTMVGYWNDPEKTRDVLNDHLWYKTGDQFILQENGYGQVVGRLKDMIIRGGENIFPKEIEDLLNTHPDVLEAYVIGIDNDRLGEEVCACVRLKDGAQFNIDIMKNFCLGNIANYKIPSQVKVVNSFPKTTSGKIQKFLLKG